MPTNDTYQGLLQHPDKMFRIDELKGCQIEKNRLGLPHGLPGNFACVYHGQRRGAPDVAIRVFTKEATDRRERYQKIHDYLKQKRLEALVEFRYYEEGILVPSSRGRKLFPVVVLDWVAGDTLDTWVKTQCHQRNTRGLRRAADAWVEVMGHLADARIAHGDLQHGNVMVTAGNKLKLVDYDCMCVPALEGRVAPEEGRPPYQHPKRNGATRLSPDLDHFSALYILVVLRALAADLTLWGHFNEKDDEINDNLLFRGEDFSDPDRSELFRQLRRSPDAHVQQWAGALVDFTRRPPEKLTPLREIVNDFQRVRTLLSQKAWDEALDLVDRDQLTNPPADLQPSLQDARRRREQRKLLEKAVAAGDEAEMKRLVQSPLLQDYPAIAAARAVALQAPKVIAALKELRGLRDAGQGRDLVRVWDQQAALLATRRSAAGFVADVQKWRARNEACDLLLRTLQTDTVGATLRAAWERVQAAGGHPEATAQQATVEQRIHRHDAYALFGKVPGEATFENDTKLVAGWNEGLFKGWPVAEADRPRLIGAQARLKKRKEIEALLQKPDERGREAELIELVRDLPAGYDKAILRRGSLAGERLQFAGRVQQLLEAGTPSESQISETWQKLQQAQGIWLLSSTDQQRCELAVKRAPLVEAVRRADSQASKATRDTALLAAWNDALLTDCPEIRHMRPAWVEAGDRRSLLQIIQGARQADDRITLAECAKSPLLVDFPLAEEVRLDLADAVSAVRGMTSLLGILKQNQRGEFRRAFDRDHLRRYAGQFKPYQQQLKEWVRSEILPLPLLGLGPPMGLQPLRVAPARTGASGAKCEIRWIWPPHEVCDSCVLAICHDQPRPGSLPSEVQTLQHWRIQRSAFEGGGGYWGITLRPELAGKIVVVWAIIDLGFEDLYSEPVPLGRLADGARK